MAAVSILATVLSAAQRKQPAPGESLQRDYIYPSAQATTAAAAEPADGDTVNYKGTLMRQFNGRYTAVVIKPEDLAAFTLERVRITVDRNDVLYAQFREFLGWEPPGEGLLLVVYFPAPPASLSVAG